MEAPYRRSRVQNTLNALESKIDGGDIKREPKKKKSKSEEIHDRKLEKKKIDEAYASFTRKVKEDLLFECLCNMYKPLLKKRTSPRTESIANNLVKEFIKEHNINTLLNNYKKKSLLLSEVSFFVEEQYPLIMETVDKDNPMTYDVDTELRDNFFDSLQAQEFDAMSSVLNQRIASAMDDFVIDNIQTKAEIRDIIQQTKERIDAKRDDVSEGVIDHYNYVGRRRIQEAKQSRPKTILNALVYNITESAVKNEELKKIYTDESGKLDLDTIVDEAVTIYSFLEMVNTYKLDRVDKNYITNFLESFKTK